MTRRLLLIDDDEISREVMALRMAGLGVEMLVAADGEAGLRMLSEGSGQSDGILPDGILLDAQLPGLSGASLVAALRRVTSAPVLVFSASGIAAELAEAADGFLQKSAEPEAILAAFEAARENAGQPRAQRGGDGVLASAGEASCVIDPAVLAKFRMPESVVRSMYVALAEDCARRWSLLEAAMRVGDADAVRAEAHAIKGGAGMLGARGLQSVAAALELESRATEWPQALRALGEALAALRAVLEDATFSFAASSV